MIPWGWVIGAAWAGGVTAQLVGMVYNLAGASRIHRMVVVLALAWPVALPVLALMAGRLRQRLTRKEQSLARLMVDAPEEQIPEMKRETASSPPLLCEACIAILNDPPPLPPYPAACDECRARELEWNASVKKVSDELHASLCPACQRIVRPHAAVTP